MKHGKRSKFQETQMNHFLGIVWLKYNRGVSLPKWSLKYSIFSAAKKWWKKTELLVVLLNHEFQENGERKKKPYGEWRWKKESDVWRAACSAVPWCCSQVGLSLSLPPSLFSWFLFVRERLWCVWDKRKFWWKMINSTY